MKNSILKQVAELPKLSMAKLRERWRILHGSDPPAYNKAFLVKRLAHRVQELAHGGLSKRARDRLRQIDADSNGDGEIAPMNRRKRKDNAPVAGTRLIREWQGERHEVTVVVGGFEFDGRRYRSLSAIAREITGTQWNGPDFFGLRKRRSKPSS